MRTEQPRHPLTHRLLTLHERLGSITDGDVASYIPALALADPDSFGISMVSVDGRRYSVGDSATPFTIQSVSKPFVYALALADAGAATVLSRVGAEPTGDAFNAVTLEAGTGRPMNPMVNAGAIETACLVAGVEPATKTARIVSGLSDFAGRILEIDDDVLRSESETGDRNRALAYLMQGAGALSLPVDQALEVYFTQCSVLVTGEDLAVMAATLANGGVNPVTGGVVVPPEVIGPVLSVMATCGMYDAAGTWLFRVGLPAKSGVSGGVIAVLPGQFGLGLWSPPLDAQGNSVRGVLAASELSRELGLHLFTPTGQAASPIRRWTTATTARSVAPRSPEQQAVLDEHAHDLQLIELQGALHDLAVETLAHRLLEAFGDAPGRLVLDVRHVGSVHEQARHLLDELLATLTSSGTTVAVTDPRPHARGERPIGTGVPEVAHYRDREEALVAMEDSLLRQHGLVGGMADAALPADALELLGDLDASDREAVIALTSTRVVPAGSIVIDSGSPPDGLAWVTAGEVSVLVRSAVGGWHRVSRMGAGSVLGEISMIDGLPRSARVVSETPALLVSLDAGNVAELRAEHPTSYAALVLALARLLSSRLRRANTVIQALQD